MKRVNNIKKQTITGFIWRFLQNSCSEIINFIVSIVLARILSPNDYGIIAMITVFTNIALVFFNTGFSSAIVQRKDLTEKDVDTIFYSGLFVSAVLYFILFCGAGYISQFYSQPELVSLVRVYSLIILIASSYSVQQALVQREMQFRKSFYMSMSGAIVHGIVGVVLAYLGFGVWAIVYSTLAHYLVCALVMWVLVEWKPRFIFSSDSLRQTLPFSLKILASNLINALFNNIRSLIIGRCYSSEQLAYYNKGYQFPTLLMNQIDGACTSVMFSSLSKFQDNWESGLKVLRRELRTVYFICAPVLLGLCAISKPMIIVLLTEKWIESVPFVQLVSILCLMWPLSVQTHAINALGKSNISLAVNIIGKCFTIVGLLLTYKISVLAIVITSICTTFLSAVLTVIVSQKYLKYKVTELLSDIMPSIFIALVMSGIVYSLTYFVSNPLANLVIGVTLGMFIYILLSLLFNRDNFLYLLNLSKSIIKR